MQNRYVGDIGDFGKYGLLRALCSPLSGSEGRRLSLGVVWYLVPDEAGNGDGTLTDYLDSSAKNRVIYRSCDPTLYDGLREVVSTLKRNVKTVLHRGIFPPGTIAYDAILTFQGMPAGGLEVTKLRLANRRRWSENALEAMAGHDVVFVSADDGLEVGSTARHHSRGPKFAFYDELSPYLRRGQSLIIYQHTGHTLTAEVQIRMRMSQVSRHMADIDPPYALLYHRGRSRAFIVVPAEAHSRILLERAQQFVRGRWGQLRHFTLIAPNGSVVG